MNRPSALRLRAAAALVAPALLLGGAGTALAAPAATAPAATAPARTTAAFETAVFVGTAWSSTPDGAIYSASEAAYRKAVAAFWWRNECVVGDTSLTRDLGFFQGTANLYCRR
ncbi:hypothetical protein ACIPYS_37080 [Kitasatospora sp. NPDC089913]|uniref:hypothetical protein n=1 Tax=Streptomycetaceae TaxID=2062 RepID=UPI00087BB656|nr:hypothetical protein [Streptomyces sp. TLI_053]SDT75854.1 hypothetical protein SAMN05216371_5045 [Streptomyces sp. TLI_053]